MKTSESELICVRNFAENKELAVNARFAHSWFANSSRRKQIPVVSKLLENSKGRHE